MKIEWIEKYMTQAENFILNEEVDKGLALLNSLLYDEPGYGRLHNHLGWAYMYYGSDDQNAELHLRMAILFDSEYQAPYLHIGELMNRLKRYDDALRYLEMGLTKQDANKMSLLEAIGLAYESKREYSKAIKAYKSAMLESMYSYYTNKLSEGIKRCRRKQFATMFSF
jgi:tetratricopeptide (TPR) repeat protein